ncbi:hypothetical protein WA538_002171 [Blastocystis sp. DL]
MNIHSGIRHPLRVYTIGDEVRARLGDKYFPAKIIEMQVNKTDPLKNNYYIHFGHVNRRMDTWMTAADILPYRVDSGDVIEKDKIVDTINKLEVAGVTILQSSGVIEYYEPEHTSKMGMDDASIREHEEVTKVKNIKSIQIGRYIIDSWYFSPFPKEMYPTGHTDCLFICEYCLSFFLTYGELHRHMQKCTFFSPPGDEIYRKDNISVFEVDGNGDYNQRVYAENISYIAKLFLDHKTLYYDVTPFYFYVITEYDDQGYHVVGYFSKEKCSELGYNLACIMTLPPHQRKGYGHFMIEFSYELSKIEKKVGSPEKPLSDLGHISYHSFWKEEIVKLLSRSHQQMLSLIDIAKMTSFTIDDIMETLKLLDLLKYYNGQYILTVPQNLIDMMTKPNRKGPTVCPSCIHWRPSRFSRKDKWSYANLGNEEKLV